MEYLAEKRMSVSLWSLTEREPFSDKPKPKKSKQPRSDGKPKHKKSKQPRSDGKPQLSAIDKKIAHLQSLAIRQMPRAIEVAQPGARPRALRSLDAGRCAIKAAQRPVHLR